MQLLQNVLHIIQINATLRGLDWQQVAHASEGHPASKFERSETTGEVLENVRQQSSDLGLRERDVLTRTQNPPE